MTHIAVPARNNVSDVTTRGLTLDSKEALNRFLASVERRAFVMARMATRHAEEALDIVQDSMLQLAQHYGNRPETEWGPLFYRILQRRIYDWYRRERVRNRWRHWFPRNEDDDSDPLENQPDPAMPDPANSAATDRTLVALNAAVAELPLRQQQAFLLRAYEGLDVEQTAKAMGCTAGSVKTHYSRAVHTLRERLKDHWQ